MKLITPHIMLFLLSLSLSAQQFPCGTRLSERQSRLLDQMPHITRDNARVAVSVRNIAISAHIIKADDGTGGLSDQQLSAAIDNLNSFYINAGLQFFVAFKDEIPDTQLYDFKTTSESEMGQTYDVENTLNIYFANSVYDAGAGYLCGYSYFPDGPDRVIMQNSCATNGSSLPHEIGHYFTLIHTHGKSNNQLTDELVNGSNCATAGDEICDTPADPYLNEFNVSATCAYIGTKRDANNQLFVPDPTNIMSYSVRECRDVLTSGQYARIADGYNHFRTYLYDRSVVAAFASDVQQPCVGMTVTFDDRSLNAVKWQWIFDGGSSIGDTTANPTVVYSSAGDYDVTLIITGANALKDTLVRKNFIHVVPEINSILVSGSASFESESIEQVVQNPDSSKTFEITTRSAAQGDKSIMVNFFEYANEGASDLLVFPFIDNSFSGKYQIDFDYAYSYFDDQYFDILEVVYRPACSAIWQSVWSKSGNVLATAPPQDTDFIPTPAQWKHETIELEMDGSIELFEWGFRATNGYGNNLYIDNVKLNPVMEVMVSNTLCPNLDAGQIEITTYGTRIYDFSLNDQIHSNDSIFNGLSGGIYMVKVEDDLGRIYSEQVEVLSKSMTLDVQDANCYSSNDGLLNVDITGGSLHLDFLVDEVPISGFLMQNLLPGDHHLRVRAVDGSCEVIENFNISRPDSLYTVLDIINSSCADELGQVTLQTIGGTLPYTFQIDNGTLLTEKSHYLFPGEHILKTIDSKGCEHLVDFEITSPDSLKISYGVSGFLCPKIPGGVVSMFVEGGIGEFTFTLDGVLLEEHIAKLSEAGNYEIGAIDQNGCEIRKLITVDYAFETPEIPKITLSNNYLHIQYTEANVSWYRNDELVADSVLSIPYEEGFVYTVGLSYGEGQCEVISDPFILLAVDDQRWDELIKVYPNPVLDEVHLIVDPQLSRSFEKIVVYDMSGQHIAETTCEHIDANWKKGVYLIEVLGQNWKAVKRIVKN